MTVETSYATTVADEPTGPIAAIAVANPKRTRLVRTAQTEEA